MSIPMDEEIKLWTAKRKTALVMEIIQGKTSFSEAFRAFDLPSSEIEAWVNDAKQGMENALRAKGIEISLSQLCHWFGLPRRSGHYRSVKAASKLQEHLVRPIKAIVEENPSFGYRTVAEFRPTGRPICVVSGLGWT